MSQTILKHNKCYARISYQTYEYQEPKLMRIARNVVHFGLALPILVYCWIWIVAAIEALGGF